MHLESRPGGEVSSDQQGLVEASSPESPAVKRYRNDQAILCMNMECHEPAHEPRQPDPSPVLQPQHQILGKSAIDDCSGCSVVAWRVAYAGCALQSRFIHRQTATGTTGAGEEVEREPAFGANFIIIAHDSAATGTSWRKGELYDERGRAPDQPPGSACRPAPFDAQSPQ